MNRLLSILELACVGIAISWGVILASAVLYTKLTGWEYIIFSFNLHGEHLFEAIVFPLVMVMAFVFWCIRARRFGKEL